MIIGLAGPKGGGKDTIANGLAEIFQLDKRRYAEKLYVMAATFDPVFHPDMLHSDKEDWVLGDPDLGTRREFIEKLGTEFGREMIHRDIWTKGLISSIAMLPTVVADVRFESEADAIRNLGGVIIHLRPDWTDFGRKHVSDFPLTIAPGDLALKTYRGQTERAIEQAAEFVARAFGR